jgi:uncharacterized protein (UPF0332 family)
MSNENNFLALCKYRFQQADETLCEARLLLEAGHFRGAVNRAYYAMFYALQVLLIKNKIRVSKHSGLISYFDREYIKTGIIDKKFSKWLHRLFDLRQDADYGDMFAPTETQCMQAVQQADEFVRQIRTHLKNTIFFE